MIKNLTVQVLCDNTASGDYLGEHGLSFFITADKTTILFDTGRGFALKHNIKASNLTAGDTDYLIFSHGHYDHTGGIKDFFTIPDIKNKAEKGNIKIIIHPDGLNEKYSKTENGAKYIGISRENKNILQKYKKNLILTHRIEYITDDIILTGEIPSLYELEKGKTKFFSNKSLSVKDPLYDDKSLFFRTEKGIIVLLGCCHSGLGNTLDYISETENTDKIYAVIGGTHLRNANRQRLEFTVDILKKYNVQLFAPNHCTGQNSISYIYSHLPAIIHPAPAGSIFRF